MITKIIKLDKAFVSSIHDLVADGEKVKAIKEVRQETGFGLKEAKDLVDSAFSSEMMDKLGVTILNIDSPGYYIDRIFELSKELSDCYSKLESMGFNFTTK